MPKEKSKSEIIRRLRAERKRLEKNLARMSREQMLSLNVIGEWSIKDVLEYFHGTHLEFMLMIEAMPEDEILTAGNYAFIGKGAVYDWLSAYAAHDRWAKTHIRKWVQSKV